MPTNRSMLASLRLSMRFKVYSPSLDNHEDNEDNQHNAQNRQYAHVHLLFSAPARILIWLSRSAWFHKPFGGSRCISPFCTIRRLDPRAIPPPAGLKSA